METIEDIEGRHCSKCARNGHFGWCDKPYILCSHKDRIKELMGIADKKDKDRLNELMRVMSKQDR